MLRHLPHNRISANLLIGFLWTWVVACSTSIADQPKPVFIVIELDPWIDVLGSDSPIFALYDDGVLVYRRDPMNVDTPFATRKVPSLNAFREELVSFDLAKAEEFYELTSATDQITTLIWTPDKTIRIYGDWRKPLPLGIDSNPETNAFSDQAKRIWESFPNEIRQTLLKIGSQRTIKGTAWFPETIEVMFWPYEYAPDESTLWPKEWPDLYSRGTRKRKENSYSVYLPHEKLTELLLLLRTRKDKGAILIDGKKMAVATRYPFPGEEAWMK